MAEPVRKTDPVAPSDYGADSIRVLKGLDAARDRTGLLRLVGAPRPALAVKRLPQRAVELKQVGRL